MFSLIKINRNFFYPFFILILLGLILIIKSSPVEIILWVNRHTYPVLDPFFIFFTAIGDGLAFTIVAMVLIWFNYRRSIQAFLIFGISSLVSQGLKNLVFPVSLRPYAYLKSILYPVQNLRLIPGVQILMQHSFPSGHSITGFSLALFLCLWIPNKAYAGLCLLLGIAIAYSRMYLLEHFFLDIYWGAIIGVLLTLITYFYLNKTNWPNQAWADKGLRDTILKRKTAS